jgi:hypothetical protein
LTLSWPRCAAASTARNETLRQREAVFRDVAGRVYQTRPLCLCSTQCLMFSPARSRAAATTNLGALKPLFGVACPVWWGKESPRSSTSSRSAPDRRLVTRRQPNSAPDRCHLMACKRTWQVTRPVAPHVSRPIPLGFRTRSHCRNPSAAQARQRAGPLSYCGFSPTPSAPTPPRPAPKPPPTLPPSCSRTRPLPDLLAIDNKAGSLLYLAGTPICWFR